MKAKAKAKAKTEVTQMVPQEIVDILGPPPVLSEEERKVYYATLACFAKDIAPRDLITWFLIKDLADHRCLMALYRRLKAAAMTRAHDIYVQKLISTVTATRDREWAQLRKAAEASSLSASQSIHDPEELETKQKEIKNELQTNLNRADSEQAEILKKYAKLKDENLIYEFGSWHFHHEKIDGLLEVSERRFAASLREIERHLGGFGQSLRRNVENMIEGEVVQVEPHVVPVSPATTEE